MAFANKEMIGPIESLFNFDKKSEVVSLTTYTELGLAFCFYSRACTRTWRVSESLDCGMAVMNAGLISTAEASFVVSNNRGWTKEACVTCWMNVSKSNRFMYKARKRCK